MSQHIRYGMCVLLCFFVSVGFTLAPVHERITKAAFVQKYLDLAMEVNKLHGIPVSVCLGQAMLESESGNSELALGAKNFFGMKCKGEETGYSKHDDEEHASCFRMYEDVNASFADYGARLGSNPIYARVQALRTQNETDPQVWLETILSCGYASDQQYVSRVMNIIQEQNLTQYDRIRPGHYEHSVNESNKIGNTSGSAYGTSLADTVLENAFADSVEAVLTQPNYTEVAAPQELVIQAIPVPFQTETAVSEQSGMQVYPSPPLMHPLRIQTAKRKSHLTLR